MRLPVMRAALWRCLAALIMLGGAVPSRAQQAEGPARDTLRRAWLGADYTLTAFDGGSIDPWHLASLSLTGKGERGAVVGRVNHARRFARSGLQYEVDAYPRFGRTWNAYFNVGYGAASVFPQWRGGAELYAELPNAWESSFGIRQLRFSGSPVTLWTGTIAKYSGNYWISLRPYFRSTTNGNSTSANLTARRYFADGDHFIGARLGYGSTPSDLLTADQVARTNSFSGDVHGSLDVIRDLLGTWTVGYDHEALADGSIRKSWIVEAGLKVRL
ncbi:MAG: YaiO family outer membrane beta-barrel protein [bacterium]